MVPSNTMCPTHIAHRTHPVCAKWQHFGSTDTLETEFSSYYGHSGCAVRVLHSPFRCFCALISDPWEMVLVVLHDGAVHRAKVLNNSPTAENRIEVRFLHAQATVRHDTAHTSYTWAMATATVVAFAATLDCHPIVGLPSCVYVCMCLCSPVCAWWRCVYLLMF